MEELGRTYRIPDKLEDRSVGVNGLVMALGSAGYEVAGQNDSRCMVYLDGILAAVIERGRVGMVVVAADKKTNRFLSELKLA